MTVTGKLHLLYQTDRKLRGLRSRLGQAERFLQAQVTHLAKIEKQTAALSAQHRQLLATIANDETEATAAEEHIAELRERMNNAHTNKEYKALLTEVNTFKDKKTEIEDRELGLMETDESLKAQLGELSEQKVQREKMRETAEQTRKERAEEIAGKLSELEKERNKLAADVPPDAMGVYDALVTQLGDDDEVMAPIEIHDRKRHEYHCGACMMGLPVETMSALLSHGGLTRCVSCGCILYIDEPTREAMDAGSKK